MHLADLIPDADTVLALEPDELGQRILQVLNSWPAHQALQLSTFVNTTLGHPQTPGSGPYPTNRRGELQEALSTAWAWLEGRALLIPDTRYGEGVVKLSPPGKKNLARLASSGNPVANGEIDEAGCQARFERWEQLGLDVIRIDLEATGGRRVVGGSPAVRRLAWEWVGIKEAERAAIAVSPGAARSKAPALPDHPPSSLKPPAPFGPRAELFTLRPGIWGMSLDIKEAWRRARRWWRGNN
jgi:hypothetical protein